MKTNAVRLLESREIDFRIHTYDHSDGFIDARSVAGKLGIPPERLFKTLVARKDGGDIVVFCIPGSTELDLKKAANATGAKNVELVQVAELKVLTGYERGGCSPIGLKRAFPVWLEESAEAFERILISGGQIGLQIELAPDDLRRAIKATIADLV